MVATFRYFIDHVPDGVGSCGAGLRGARCSPDSFRLLLYFLFLKEIS